MNIQDLLNELDGYDPEMEVVIVTLTDKEELIETGEFEDFSPSDVSSALDGHLWEPEPDNPITVQYGQLQLRVRWVK